MNKLQASFASLIIFASGHSAGHYLSMLSSITAFSDWKVDHRYYGDSLIPSSFEAWAQAGLEVQYMVEDAQLRGVI